MFVAPETTIAPLDTPSTAGNTPGITVTPEDSPPTGGELPFTGSGSGLLHRALLLAFVLGGVALGLSGGRFARR